MTRRSIKASFGVVLTFIGLGIAALAGGPAGADTTDSTTANSAVGSVLALSGLTSSFSLNGDPNTTSNAITDDVSMTVESNNLTGYNVTVQAAADSMDPATAGNADSIPIADLKVKNDAAAFTSLSDLSSVTVASTSARSANGGDTVTNDYRLAIPWVNADTYSVTLDYTVADNA
jgi:hypothetical protein